MGPFGVLPHFAFNSNCGQNQKDHILRWRETRSFRQWGLVPLVQWFQDHILSWREMWSFGVYHISCSIQTVVKIQKTIFCADAKHGLFVKGVISSVIPGPHFELTRNMAIRCFTTFRVQFKLWSKSKRPYSVLTRNTVLSSKWLVQWFQDNILSWHEIWSFGDLPHFELWSKSKTPYSVLTRNTVFASKDFHSSWLSQWSQSRIRLFLTMPRGTIGRNIIVVSR